MIIKDRKMGQYVAGYISLKKTSEENIAVIHKVKCFLQQYSTKHIAVKCGGLQEPMMSLGDSHFEINRVVFNLTEAKGYKVRFDYYKREVKFYADNTACDRTIVVEESSIDTSSLDTVFEKIINWVMPLRLITTTVVTHGEHNTANPAGGTIRSITIHAEHSASDSFVKALSYTRLYDDEGNEIDSHIDVTAKMDSEYDEFITRRILDSKFEVSEYNDIHIDDDAVYVMDEEDKRILCRLHA